MAGYSAREGESIGMLDPLESHLVYMESKGLEISIAVFDVLGIPNDFPKELDGTVFIPVATHTHSAPKPSLVGEYMLDVARDMLKDAKENATKCERIEHVVYRSFGVCGFRDVHEIEPLEFHVIHFESSRAFSLVVFPCHPTVLGPDNRMYSADLAGGIRRKMKKAWKREVVFLNSCAGNLSTRDTRIKRDISEVNRLAGIVAERSEKLKTEEFEPGRLSFRETEITLETERKHIEDLNETTKPALSLLKDEERYRVRRHRLCKLEISDLVFMFHPFEMFYQSCRRLDGIVVGYSCGYGSYLLPGNSSKGYEWLASPYPAGADEIVLEELRNL